MRAHCSAVMDFYDNEHVQDTLYPEYENLIRSLVPEAEHVFVGGHILRNPEAGKGDVQGGKTDFQTSVNAPHKFMHCDFGNRAPRPRLTEPQRC